MNAPAPAAPDPNTANGTRVHWRLTSWLSASLLILTGSEAHAADAPANDLDFYLEDKLTHDDNVFRLPAASDPLLSATGTKASRDDDVNRLAGGVNANWALSQQALQLNARLEHNTYRYNDDLDHTGGAGKAEWKWALGERAYGQLGADFTRALAGFANTRLLVKDLVDSGDVYWRGTLRLGSRWLAGGAARYTTITHGADERRSDNANLELYEGSLRYRTSLDNTFGVVYRRTNGSRPDAAATASYRSYVDDSVLGATHIAFTTKTSLDAEAGRVNRTYPQSSTREDFSGNVWDATLAWKHSQRTSVALSGWRKLRAYLDANSDYFVATGGGVEMKWEPTQTISAAVEAFKEQRRYLAANSALITDTSRVDDATGAELALTYMPRQRIEFDLSCHLERRSSNRDELDYDANVVSLGLRFTL